MADWARVVISGGADEGPPLEVVLAILDALAMRWPTVRLEFPPFDAEPTHCLAVIPGGAW